MILIRLALVGSLLAGSLLLLPGCDGSTSQSGNGVAFIQQSERDVADRDLLIGVAREFYQNHPDEYDMLVLWSDPEFSPGHSFYFPVKNDVPGIGYAHEGPEFFDDSAAFGSTRLQGIVWMGPAWITNAEEGLGPRSVLGILAQETGHRWGATVHFMDSTNTDSSALLEDAYHWSIYLDTGASPMGGNKWEALGGTSYQTVPVDYVEYSQLDLYLMGLLPAESVEPVRLLVNVRPAAAPLIVGPAPFARRASQPFTVEADVMEVSIEQIIEVEGRRDPDVGFNAKMIRQAWIYVYRNPAGSSVSEISRIKELQNQWGDYYNQATDGLSSMNTSLY